MAFLELVRGSSPGTRFELNGGQAVIGRSAECEVPIDTPAVSRRHAAVISDGDGYYLEDLKSRNKTFLNEQEVVERVRLKDGDRLVICDHEFRFFSGNVSSIGYPTPSSVAELVDDTKPGSNRASVMATFDVSGKSASWGLSAKPEVKLAALLEISNNLAQTLSLADILPKLLDSLFKIFTQADRGFVVMRTKPDGPIAPVAVKTRRPGDEERMRISRTIVEEAMSVLAWHRASPIFRSARSSALP